MSGFETSSSEMCLKSELLTLVQTVDKKKLATDIQISDKFGFHTSIHCTEQQHNDTSRFKFRFEAKEVTGKILIEWPKKNLQKEQEFLPSKH